MVKPFTPPKTLARCADVLYATRAKRYALQGEIKALEEIEKQLKDRLIRELPKSQATGIAGRVARARIVKDEVPQTRDWEALYAHIRETGEFELLQRRLTKTAVQERWDDGKEVPGVESFTVVSVSLEKV